MPPHWLYAQLLDVLCLNVGVVERLLGRAQKPGDEAPSPTESFSCGYTTAFSGYLTFSPGLSVAGFQPSPSVPLEMPKDLYFFPRVESAPRLRENSLNVVGFPSFFFQVYSRKLKIQTREAIESGDQRPARPAQVEVSSFFFSHCESKRKERKWPNARMVEEAKKEKQATKLKNRKNETKQKSGNIEKSEKLIPFPSSESECSLDVFPHVLHGSAAPSTLCGSQCPPQI